MAATVAAAASTDSSDVTSIWTVETVPLRAGRDFRALAAASSLDGERQARMMWKLRRRGGDSWLFRSLGLGLHLG